jgi:hypothetical protein
MLCMSWVWKNFDLVTLYMKGKMDVIFCVLWLLLRYVINFEYHGKQKTNAQKVY